MVSAATILVRSPYDRILLHLRDDGGEKDIPFPNMWNFPGGMKEEGESHADAAIRELYEEFEIVLKRDALELITVFSHEHARDDHVYLAAVPDERIPAIHEGADAQWKTLEQIKQLQLGFSQERLVPHIERAVTGCEPSEQ